VRLIEEIARGAGTIDGMIGGQVIDLEAEHRKLDPATLEYIHRSKRAALITASVVSGGLYAGADDDAVSELRSFGQSIGLAFQIVDDVLDAPKPPSNWERPPEKTLRRRRLPIRHCLALKNRSRKRMRRCSRL
jgi:geranylgeranyl pyrophosphate synthase